MATDAWSARRGLRAILAIADFLLGFVALSVFAYLVLSEADPSNAAWRRAFLVAGAIALVEVAILIKRERPANRLVIAANVWLIAGGIAFLTRQWWWLDLYARLDAAGLYGFMAVAGVATTWTTSAGFVGAPGERRHVIRASLVLLALTAAALAAALAGSVDRRAAWPVIGLAYANLLLRLWVTRAAKPSV